MDETKIRLIDVLLVACLCLVVAVWATTYGSWDRPPEILLDNIGMSQLLAEPHASSISTENENPSSGMFTVPVICHGLSDTQVIAKHPVYVSGGSSSVVTDTER